MKREFDNLKNIAERYISDMILMNNIAEADKEFISVPYEFEEYLSEEEIESEIYQFYATSLEEYQVKFLVKKYHLLFKYSELLDTYFLCVTSFGNPWENVLIEEHNN